MHLLRTLGIAAALTFAAPVASPIAAAADMKVGVVDLQRALNEVREGELAQARLKGMYDAKLASLKQMEADLQARAAEFEKQSAILSEAARQAKQNELMQQQMVFQQTYMQAEGEMQQELAQMTQTLVTKMKAVAAEIGKERGYTMILDVGGAEGFNVVYHQDGMDLTTELIKRYDAQSGG